MFNQLTLLRFHYTHCLKLPGDPQGISSTIQNLIVMLIHWLPFVLYWHLYWECKTNGRTLVYQIVLAVVHFSTCCRFRGQFCWAWCTGVQSQLLRRWDRCVPIGYSPSPTTHPLPQPFTHTLRIAQCRTLAEHTHLLLKSVSLEACPWLG